MEENGASQRVRPSSISSMGQLLLRGYAMLAESCDDCGVPLMRKPDGSQTICVNCGKEDPPSGLHQGNGTAASHASESPPASTQHEEEPEEIVVEEARAPAPAPSTFEPSEAIAQKMLEGWTLMAEHCPRCSTPLVRSREGRIYCVKCEMYAVRETDLQRQPAAAPPAAAAASVAPAPPAQRPRRPNGVMAAAGMPSDVLDRVSAAASVVAARLGSGAAALAGATRAEARDVLKEIKECADVLERLKALLQ